LDERLAADARTREANAEASRQLLDAINLNPNYTVNWDDLHQESIAHRTPKRRGTVR
jgi:hypothetical protein